MTTDTSGKTPLAGLISCGSCGAPMRYDEAAGDHGPLYICDQEHRTKTEVRLQARATDRLVISGVLNAILAEKSIATVQSIIRQYEEQGYAGSGLPDEDISPLIEDLSLFLRAAGSAEKTRNFLTMFITDVKLFPDRAVVVYAHAAAGRQPPGRGDGAGGPALAQSRSLTGRVQAGPSAPPPSAPGGAPPRDCEPSGAASPFPRPGRLWPGLPISTPRQTNVKPPGATITTRARWAAVPATALAPEVSLPGHSIRRADTHETAGTEMFKKIVARIRNLTSKPCGWCEEKSVGLRTVRNRTPDGWVTSQKVRACQRHLSGRDNLPPAERTKLKNKGAWGSWWR